MVTLELFELKNLCKEMAKLGAAEYAATQAPAQDLIKQRAAYREFGEARVKSWVHRKLVTATRVGDAKNSPLKYSRAELIAISNAERLNCIINK